MANLGPKQFIPNRTVKGFGSSSNCLVNSNRFNKVDLNNYVLNVAIEVELPRIQCEHEGCITLLSSSSLKLGIGLCHVHNNSPLENDYSEEDTLTVCNAKISYRFQGAIISHLCKKPGSIKVVVNGTVFMRCRKHSLR